MCEDLEVCGLIKSVLYRLSACVKQTFPGSNFKGQFSGNTVIYSITHSQTRHKNDLLIK